MHVVCPNHTPQHRMLQVTVDPVVEWAGAYLCELCWAECTVSPLHHIERDQLKLGLFDSLTPPA